MGAVDSFTRHSVAWLPKARKLLHSPAPPHLPGGLVIRPRIPAQQHGREVSANEDMRKGSSCWGSLNRRIKASGRSCSQLGGRWGWWEPARGSWCGEQSSPSTGTHAHTEHLFAPMDVQGSFAVINLGGGAAGRRGRKAFGCEERLGEERKMNSLPWHLSCHQPCGLSLWL